MALECVGQQQARLDVPANGYERVLQQLVLALALEHAQRAQDRHARGDHGRELPGHDGHLVGLDPCEELDVELLRAVLARDVEDDQPALLELLGDVLLGDRLDLAAGRDAGHVHRLEGEGRHRYAAIA